MSRTSLKCTRDLRDYPPEAYRLPNDGRKWKKLCSDRRALAMELATFANGDGTSITPGVRRLMKNLGWSRSKLFRYIADLEELKLLTSEIRNTGKGRLTSVRALHVEALTQVPDSQVPKSQIGEEPKSQIGEEPKSQIDAPQVPDSRAQVPDSRAQVPDRGTSRTPTRTDKDRPLPPTPGGGGFVDPKTSNEGNPNHHPGGGSPAGRDVVVYLKRTFHETHGTYPRNPSKEQVQQLVNLASTHGEDFKLAWKTFLAEGPSRPDTHSPYGVFIGDFPLWHRPVRKPNTHISVPPWATEITSKGAINEPSN